MLRKVTEMMDYIDQNVAPYFKKMLLDSNENAFKRAAKLLAPLFGLSENVAWMGYPEEYLVHVKGKPLLVQYSGPYLGGNSIPDGIELNREAERAWTAFSSMDFLIVNPENGDRLYANFDIISLLYELSRTETKIYGDEIQLDSTESEVVNLTPERIFDFFGIQ